MLHSGDYYLFESDSEDEDELQSEEQKPQKQTACQVLTHTIYSHKQKRKVLCCMMYAVAKMRCLSQLAYQAWVTSVKTALRERQNRQGRLKRTEGDERADSHKALSVKGWIYLHRFLIRYWITRHPWSQTGKSVIYKSVRITCELVND